MGWISGVIIAVVVALGGAYVGGGSFSAGYVMPGDAMFPAIVRGGSVHVRLTRPDSFSRGQVVLFQAPGEEGYSLRRVVALPGETVELIQGELRINGAKMIEPWLQPKPGEEPRIENPSPDYYPALTLADGQIFVMGDLRKGSRDSRAYGAVPIGNVVGVVWDVFGMLL